MGACHVTIIGVMVYKKSKTFEVFLRISPRFFILLMKSFLVARSYVIIAMNIKILIIGSIVTPGNEAQSPFLAVFDNFGHFSSCLYWHKPLAQDTDFF